MQSAGQQCNCRVLPRSGAKPSLVFRRPVPTRAARRQQACTCSAEQRHAHGLSRREALLAFGGAAAVALTPLPSSAEEGGACTAAGHQSGCTRCLHTLRLRSYSVLLQKQRLCMAEPPHPQVMVAMEAMLRRLPSEASICILYNAITWLRFNASLQGSLLLFAGTHLSTQPPGSLTQSTRWAHTEAPAQCHPPAIAFMHAFALLPALLGRASDSVSVGCCSKRRACRASIPGSSTLRLAKVS